MKLLLDQGLAAQILRNAGFDAVHTGELGMARTPDTDILAHALRDGRTVVTLDADFHSLLALSNATAPSVIRIRIERLKSAECAEVIQKAIGACGSDLQAGAAVSVEPHRIRIRRLPLTA